MISDEYTREYDERQRKQKFLDDIDKVALMAKRFGCDLIIKVRQTGITYNVMMSNGERLAQFHDINTALVWADKWK